MSTALNDLHLGVGVAAHEHDAHLARTLEAIDALLAEAGVMPEAKVVAASDGSTAAEKIAAAHGWAFRRISPGVPRTLAAAREAARRACGGEAQLLVDGDVAVQPGWLAEAVALLREHERLAGVSGAIDEAHWRNGALVGGRHDVYGTHGTRGFTTLRDSALWRRSALDAAGGFDPWLPGEDEAEMCERLRMAGFSVAGVDRAVAVRHGVARESFADLTTFLRSGMSGPGMVLRRARGTMAFPRHLARYRGALLLFAWMVAGAVVAFASPNNWMIWLWATAGLLVFFSVMRQSLPRAFWRGVRALVVGAGVMRTLALPFKLPRLGVAPRPIAPPREGQAEDAAPERAVSGMPFRAAPRDPDDPPPLVLR
jgi:cellulose synthase/poly-beta-1,6-N-acetylglucosamine synthase-like glycosyltransferase